jgi:Abortive infection alpha
MSTPEGDGLELAKEAIKDLLTPVTDVLNKLLGPAATEIGLSWGDSFRVWRLKRTVQLLEEVRETAIDAGFHLKPVAPRLLFPLLESASLEDDEDLHKCWVALLSNASRPNSDTEVLPSFPNILKQLTSEEARFLNDAYDKVAHETKERLRRGVPQLGDQPMLDVAIDPSTVDSINRVLVNDMLRLGLLAAKLRFGWGGGEADIFDAPNPVHLTEYGKAFVRACRLPRTL